MEQVTGGVTHAKGFQAAGVSGGIKRAAGVRDLAVVFSDTPAMLAAVFTTNAVKAAPVLWSQRIAAKQSPVRAVVVNSGNANACTGIKGMEDAISMGELTAQQLGIQTEQVVVASTGVIGVPLPMDAVRAGIAAACAQLRSDGDAGSEAAQAIMTTDTSSKQFAVTLEIGGREVRIGGMAKGSGMIHPNMATMLGVVTTDAAISIELLNKAVRESVIDSFNMISVDGDTSTNDTVFVLANGAAGNPPIVSEGEEYLRFAEALHTVHIALAKQIVRDGEGATKLIEVVVDGARSEEDARRLAKSVITSSLVKTAFFGADANWGRILAAMGYSGAAFDVSQVDIHFTSRAGTIPLMDASEPIGFDEELAKSILEENEIRVDIRLGDGSAQATAWGCDLSYEYVRINGDYRS